MPIVQSFGALQAMLEPARPHWNPSSSGSINLYGHAQAYKDIYRTQPNVRICVDFLSRNIAMCGIQAFRRVSDTDRERLSGHELIGWLGDPNPATTGYRLIESLIGDLGIYFNAYWLKARYTDADGRPAIGLVRLPPDQMTVAGNILPTHYVWTATDGKKKDFALSEVVYFNGYNPCDPLKGLSPLETLRGILAEERAASEHRESFWRNASRMEGVIERPGTAPKWTPDQKKQFREQWQSRFAGRNGAGQVAVLEDGMSFKTTSFSARDSEYTIGGKLRREIVAAAFNIPQPFVGILDHATFSNIQEQHKNLYQDTLAPWFKMVTDELKRQLLIECDDQRDVYFEFNIAAKLAGSFEEQAQSLQLSVGRPIMTANEGRARLNLPRITDDESADQLAAQQGGPAAFNGPPAPPPDPTDKRNNFKPADDDDTRAAVTLSVLRANQSRFQARLAKHDVADRPAVFAAHRDRWARQIAADLAAVGMVDVFATATSAMDATARDLEIDASLERQRIPDHV